MPADIFHIDQRPVGIAQHAAVNGAGAQIKAWRGVDCFAERHQLRGAKPHVGVEDDGIEPFHHIAISGSLGAAAGADLALHLRLEIRLPLGAHDDDAKIVVMVDPGDDVIGMQHVLVQEIADRQFRRPVADGHRGHDLLPVQEQGQRLFRDHGQGHGRAGLVDARHRLRQARGVRIGGDDHGFGGGITHAPKMAQ